MLACGIRRLFGLYLYLSKAQFGEFYGRHLQTRRQWIMNRFYFFICGAVSFIALAVLRVYYLRLLYSLVHLWSSGACHFCQAVSFISLGNYGLQQPITFAGLSALQLRPIMVLVNLSFLQDRRLFSLVLVIDLVNQSLLQDHRLFSLVLVIDLVNQSLLQDRRLFSIVLVIE